MLFRPERNQRELVCRSAATVRLPQAFEERPPSSNRQKDDLPQNVSSATPAPPFLLHGRLSLKHKHRCVLREIQAALVTLAAMVLDPFARWAGVTGRMVTT